MGKNAWAKVWEKMACQSMGKILLLKYVKNPLVNGWGKMACDFRTTGQFWSNPQKPGESKRAAGT